MTIFLRFLIFILGIAVCGYKWAKGCLSYILPFYTDQNNNWLLVGWWGIEPEMATRVDDAYEGLWREPNRWPHHVTNIVVEHMRAHPQRGAKMMSFFIVASALINAALTGWIIFAGG